MSTDGWLCSVCGGLTPPGQRKCPQCLAGGEALAPDPAPPTRPKATVYQEPDLARARPQRAEVQDDLAEHDHEPSFDAHAPGEPRTRRGNLTLTVFAPLLVGSIAGWFLYGNTSPVRRVVNDLFVAVMG